MEVIETKKCTNKEHRYISKYPSDSVPVQLFNRKNPGEPLKHCEDCRTKRRKRRKVYDTKKREEILPEHLFMCTTCMKKKDIMFVAKLENGGISKQCLDCKDHLESIKKRTRANARALRMSRILETGISCAVLNEIHLIPLPATPYNIRRLIVQNGIVTYDNVDYDAIEFVNNHKDELELRHLESDHIPMHEWVSKYPNVPWRPKKREIADISNVPGQIDEFAKCQVVSILGHLKITKQRLDRQGKKHPKTILGKEKIAWVKNYKKEKQHKCELCDTSYEKEPSAFMYISNWGCDGSKNIIGGTMQYDEISLDTMIADILKKKLICGHCHAILRRTKTV